MTADAGEFAVPSPAFGKIAEIAPDLLWLRFPLPMRIGAANIYLVADGPKWAMIDAGFGDTAGLAHWKMLADGPLARLELSRLVVTHSHPDHVGGAGWVCSHFSIPLCMGELEYDEAARSLSDERSGEAGIDSLYESFGILDPHLRREMLEAHKAGFDGVVPLPSSYIPLRPEEGLRLDGRHIRILVAGGHSPAQVLLHDAQARRVFVADQVLRTAPILTLPAGRPRHDSYADYMNGLDMVLASAAVGDLVLPGHGAPHIGLGDALARNRAHHRKRMERLAFECAAEPRSIAEAVAILFGPDLNARQLNFACGEVAAYANHLVADRGAEWCIEGPVSRLRSPPG